MSQEGYAVIVGNVGSVYVGPSGPSARRVYTEYVALSTLGCGRAAYEDVTLLCEGEVVQAHGGSAPTHADS